MNGVNFNNCINFINVIHGSNGIRCIHFMNGTIGINCIKSINGINCVTSINYINFISFHYSSASANTGIDSSADARTDACAKTRAASGWRRRAAQRFDSSVGEMEGGGGAQRGRVRQVVEGDVLLKCRTF